MEGIGEEGVLVAHIIREVLICASTCSQQVNVATRDDDKAKENGGGGGEGHEGRQW